MSKGNRKTWDNSYQEFEEQAEEYFNPVRFLDCREWSLRNKDRLSELRKKVTRHTYNCLRKKVYRYDKKTLVHFDDGELANEVQKVLLHTEKNLDDNLKEVNVPKGVEIRIVEEDHLKVTEKLIKEEKLNPCVILGVHPVEPGGTFLKDGKYYSDGIEEDLYRRTTLFNAILDPHQLTFQNPKRKREWEYKIPEFGGMYCAESFIIRNCEKDGYTFLPAPLPTSFLLQLPLKKMKVQKVKKKHFTNVNGAEIYKHFFDDLMLTQTYEDKLLKKLKVMLDIVVKHGHDSIVFTPGFATVSSPPFHVAYALNKVIQKKFKHKFKVIVFPIDEEVVMENSNFKFQCFGHLQPFIHAFFPNKDMKPIRKEARNTRYWVSQPKLSNLNNYNNNNNNNNSKEEQEENHNNSASSSTTSETSSVVSHKKIISETPPPDYQRYQGYGRPSSSGNFRNNNDSRSNGDSRSSGNYNNNNNINSTRRVYSSRSSSGGGGGDYQGRGSYGVWGKRRTRRAPRGSATLLDDLSDMTPSPSRNSNNSNNNNRSPNNTRNRDFLKKLGEGGGRRNYRIMEEDEYYDDNNTSKKKEIKRENKQHLQLPERRQNYSKMNHHKVKSNDKNDTYERKNNDRYNKEYIEKKKKIQILDRKLKPRVIPIPSQKKDTGNSYNIPTEEVESLPRIMRLKRDQKEYKQELAKELEILNMYKTMFKIHSQLIQGVEGVSKVLENFNPKVFQEGGQCSNDILQGF